MDDGVPDDRRDGRGEQSPARESDPFAALYDRAVEELITVPVGETTVDTRAGPTHVLTAGDPGAPPVVVLQGGNVTTPVTLAWVQSLADEYRLFAPDTPGEPGKSAATAPTEYGPWVADVVDGLGVASAVMVGISHGGGVLLEAAVHSPASVRAAVLVVPAGFGVAPSLPLARVVGGALAYRVLPRRWLLERALAPLFSQPVADVEDVVVETVATALRTSDLGASFPGPDDPAALAAVRSPTLVVTAERDPFFPGERTCRLARDRLPAVADCHVLAGERHFLSPAGRDRLVEYVRPFLADAGVD